MIIDIKDFYSPRSKKILDDSINFAAVRTNKKKKIYYYLILLQQRNSVSKEKH